MTATTTITRNDQNTMDFLLSEDAGMLRRQRLDNYSLYNLPSPSFVVHIETKSNYFIELDADSNRHAEGLIRSWLLDLNALTARYHSVNPDGSLYDGSPIYYCNVFGIDEQIVR